MIILKSKYLTNVNDFTDFVEAHTLGYYLRMDFKAK